MMSSEIDDTVLLVTTHRGSAKFAPFVRDALNEFWPCHPPLRILTDGGVEGPDVIVGRCSDFVPLFLEGLTRLKSEFPSLTYVFHILEDHCPLRQCDAHRIEAVIAGARAHRMAAVSFVTYDWPWDTQPDELQRFGSVYGLSQFERVALGLEEFAVVPSTFFRYFQVQPALWRVDYLLSALTYANRAAILDAWSFEALQFSDALPHYISRYRWPTVHHGFLAQGKVNDEAIRFAQSRSPLRQHLKSEISGSSNEIWYRVNKFNRWVSEKASRVRRWID
jgi:hypothetical protein